MKKTFAVTDTPQDRLCDLTCGKEYECRDVTESHFVITDDAGQYTYCLWRGCAHLYLGSGKLGSWRRIDKEVPQ